MIAALRCVICCPLFYFKKLRSEENHELLQEARNTFMRFAETIALSVDDAACMFRNLLGYYGPST